MVSENNEFLSVATRPLLFLVEGLYDIEFLTRLSGILHQTRSDLPDLAMLVSAKHLIFVPTGGGSPQLWTHRFESLGCPELHFYDREQGEESQVRYDCAEIVQQRPGCRAFVTEKRSLENYLHPLAIEAAEGGCFRYRDDDDLGACVAQDWYQRTPQRLSWNELSARARSRCIGRAKKWLNMVAVKLMTLELLREQDPHDELLAVFKAVAEFVSHSR